jgi:hypothetical protein
VVLELLNTAVAQELMAVNILLAAEAAARQVLTGMAPMAVSAFTLRLKADLLTITLWLELPLETTGTQARSGLL